MTSQSSVPPWRGVFLRALAVGANVKRAAVAAGIDKTSAYAVRRRDRDFAREWDAALAAGRALVASGAPPSLGPAETVRIDRNGHAAIVRGGAGRWCQAVEDLFLGELAATANISAAARAAGMSTTAVHARKLRDAAFAARWHAAREIGLERVHLHLIARAGAAWDPAEELAEVPPVSFSEALQLLRLGERSRADAAKAAPAWQAVDVEALRAEVAARIARMAGEGSTS